MRKAISGVLFWTYPRGSWQYDLFCIVILCFIFLTPAWIFDKSEDPDTVSSLKEPSSPAAFGDRTLDTRPTAELAGEEQELPRMARPGP